MAWSFDYGRAFYISNMIALTYKGKLVELRPGVKLNITGSNPAFDPAAAGRVFSFPFSVPVTPANSAVFKHLQRLDAKQQVSSDEDAPAALVVDGSPFETGFLSVGSVTQDNMEMNFGNLAWKVLDDLGDIKIRDFMPVVDINQVQIPRWFFTVTTGLYDTYFIHINGTLISFTLPGGGTLDDAGTGLAAAINAVYPGTATYVSATDTLDIKALDNDPFVVDYADAQGITMTTSQTLAEATQKSLKTHIEDITATPIASHSFPVVRHKGLYNGLNTDFYNYVNYQHDGDFGLNTPQIGMTWTYTYMPYVRLKYVFDQIAAAAGLVWAGEIYETADFAQLSIWANYAMDKVRLEFYTDALKYLNGFKKSYDLKYYVPDMSARDFILAVCDTLNLYFDPVGDTIYLRRRVDQLTKTPLRLDGQVSALYKLTKVVNKGVTLRFKEDVADVEKETDQLDDYVIGEGVNIIEVPIRPLHDRQQSDDLVGSTGWRMCSVECKGSSDELGLGITAAPFRIFFDRGVQEDLVGLVYPMSSHLDTDTTGTVIGALSLEWDGDQGLYQTLWKHWAELKVAQTVEVSVVLPVGVLGRMLRWEEPVLRWYHPLGEVTGVIKSVQFSDSVDGVTEAKLVVMKM
jgi:hypothetical protein